MTNSVQNRTEATLADATSEGNARRCCGGWRIGLLMLAIAVAGYVFARQSSLLAEPGGSPRAEKKGDGAGADDKTTAKEKADSKVPENPFPRRFKAPSLDGGVGWLNTSGEISMKDLRGKIVILDFWTYCCINCMHVLPDLEYLEKKYPKELVVIGVHSAKFDNEKETESIRKAILKYEIEHPVINDAKMTVWRKFGARAWPTLVVVDPEGYYCGYVSGEDNRELLDVVIKKLIKYHTAKGTLDKTPFRFELERHKQKPRPLKFPGKILADEKGGRLFIADSNHNRIVIASLDGKLQDVIGTGEIGSKDGGYGEASFDHPQGMTLVNETLYVADTENHLIRKIDLKQKTVSTLIGTGKQARRRYPNGILEKMKLREVPLNSPWALGHVNGVLYICMAGPHQIWSHKLGGKSVKVFSGTGREDVINGPHESAAFAQPSGITTDGKHLYIADSEGSAIRKLDADPKGRVSTVVGASDMLPGQALFEFGDTDGIGGKARLQHALGVAYHKNMLYVADTYNHKIKQIAFTAKGGKVSSWLGDGKMGKSLKPLRFSEPSGLAVAKGRLYIADTNNHRICVADLKTGKTTVLEIAGLKPPKRPQRNNAVAAVAGSSKKLQPQTVKSGATISLIVRPKLPAGFKLNPQYPHRYRLQPTGEQALLDEKALRGKPKLSDDGKTLTAQLPISATAGKATFDVSVTIGYCRGGKGGLCKLKTLRWKLPLVAAKDGKLELTLSAEVEPKSSTKKAANALKKAAK